MQKKIIALAIVAAFAAPVAMADTANVNVYGSLDAGLRSVTTAGNTSNTFGSGTWNSNRWGFKGSEDLGDGMKANFNLESGFNTGTGASASATVLFDRTMTVGVSGGFGAVDLGRQLAVSYKVIGTYDPLGYKYINIALAGNASSTANKRYDNDISYTNKFGDVTVMAEHTIPTTGDDSTAATAAGVTFASGPINVGAAYTATKAAAATNNADARHMTVGGGFNFGDGKVSVGYAKNEAKSATVTSTDTIATNMWVGASFNVSSKIGVTAAYYKLTNTASVAAGAASVDLNTTKLMLGATYALSKRTNFYALLDKGTVETGTTTVTSTDNSGAALGLATTF